MKCYDFLSEIGHDLARQLGKTNLNHYHLDLPLSISIAIIVGARIWGVKSITFMAIVCTVTTVLPSPSSLFSGNNE